MLLHAASLIERSWLTRVISRCCVLFAIQNPNSLFSTAAEPRKPREDNSLLPCAAAITLKPLPPTTHHQHASDTACLARTMLGASDQSEVVELRQRVAALEQQLASLQAKKQQQDTSTGTTNASTSADTAQGEAARGPCCCIPAHTTLAHNPTYSRPANSVHMPSCCACF